MTIELSGSWVAMHQPWHDVALVNCDVCGRLIPRRLWRFTDEEFGALDACGPDCEHLWYEYLRDRRLRDRVKRHVSGA